MKHKVLAGTALLALLPGVANAIGLDRSAQAVDIIFEEGNYFQLNFGRIFPDVTGTDLALFGGNDTGDVADNFNRLGAGIKFQVTDRLSFAAISGEPYGIDLAYPTGESVAFGETRADVDTRELNVIGRYKITDTFSVHGGFRYTWLEANVTLAGLAYGPLNGYSASFDEAGDFGLIAGIAYERPDIALRVALTYFQGTEHDLDTTETVNGVGVGDLPAIVLGLPINPFSTESETTIETPDAINLDFQTGLNDRTLLFGRIRYAWYGDTIAAPAFYDAVNQPEIEGTTLTEIEDTYSVELGIGRRLTDRLSGSVSVGYEPEDDDDLVSPLSPTNGQKSIGLGLSYAVTDQLTLAGGARYTWLGDAFAETGTPDVARASFTDNDVFGLGLQIGYRF